MARRVERRIKVDNVEAGFGGDGDIAAGGRDTSGADVCCVFLNVYCHGGIEGAAVEG
jgi:hypothetical protein